VIEGEPASPPDRASLLLLDDVEVGPESAEVVAAHAARANQPPGQRRMDDTAEVQVAARRGDRGHLGGVGVAKPEGDGVVAADVGDQVELAADPGLAQAGDIGMDKAGGRARGGGAGPGGRDCLRREVDAHCLPSVLG
jgi:hypothetical protein